MHVNVLRFLQRLFHRSHFKFTCSFSLHHCHFIALISASTFMEGIRVWGEEMFDQAAGVHLSSSSAVYRLCAVPTGCSGGLRPCVWRGAEGRRAPWWGGRTGAAGTVLLPQERAVQTAWRSRRQKATHTHTYRNTKIQTHTQTYNKDTKRRNRTERCGEDGRDGKTRQTQSKRGRESRRKTGEVRVKTQEEVHPPEGKKEAERIVGKAESPVETHEEKIDMWKKWRNQR